MRTRAYRAEGGESRDAGGEGGRGNEPRIHGGYSAMRRGRARQKREDRACGGYLDGAVWLVKAAASRRTPKLWTEVNGIGGDGRGDAFDGGAKIGGRDGFGEEAIHARIKAKVAIFIEGVGGEGKNGDVAAS